MWMNAWREATYVTARSLRVSTMWGHTRAFVPRATNHSATLNAKVIYIENI